MIVGCIKEIKDNEYRVGLTPHGVKELKDAGHVVLVQRDAGTGSGFSNEEYAQAGAELVDNPAELCKRAEMIIKVKEPLKKEFGYFKEEQILFTYFHFASGKELTEEMQKRKITCIAYETVEDDGSRTVLLEPMSCVAGQMAPLMGAYYLAKPNHGKGVLISPVRNTQPSKTVILGGGIVGENALMNAAGLRGKVIVFEINEEKMKYLKEKYPSVIVLRSEKDAILQEIKDCDILVGAVYITGAKAPKLVTGEMVKEMQPGSVIVDVAIDQGGCIETSKPTSHSKPVYEKHGVTHYCVANMPGAYPRTSTIALTRATLPYAKKIANKGLDALKEDKGFLQGLNVYKGKIVNKGVADAHGFEYTPAEKVLK